MEDVMQQNMKLNVIGGGGGSVGSVIIPNDLDRFVVGGGQALTNVPRSMAIAYNNMTLDGASIHLTEVGVLDPVGSNTDVFLQDGWSQQIKEVKIWLFCKVDANGNPLDANGVLVRPVVWGPFPAALTATSRIIAPLIVGGGRCG